MNTRQSVLNIETTGIAVNEGHRIVEICCIELKNLKRTERIYHQYINPERHIEAGAHAIHGLTQSFLEDKPQFKDIVCDFLAFIEGSELIIHKSEWVVAFLNNELQKAGEALGQLEDHCTIVDTALLAMRSHPKESNDLQALCSRYDIENPQRVLHGGLPDAEAVADVYVAMTVKNGTWHHMIRGLE